MLSGTECVPHQRRGRTFDLVKELTGSLSRHGDELRVIVAVHLRHSRWTLRTEYGDGAVLEAESELDAEELLTELRAQLDEAGRSLNCNRYRKNALVSGMSRSMSDGLLCYLVRAWVPMLNWRLIVGALDTAPAYHVVSAREARTYLEQWRRRGVWLRPVGLVAYLFYRVRDLPLEVRSSARLRRDAR